jgi:hypothetical protein
VKRGILRTRVRVNGSVRGNGEGPTLGRTRCDPNTGMKCAPKREEPVNVGVMQEKDGVEAYNITR